MAEKFVRACKCVNRDSWTKDIDETNPLHHISKSKKVKGQVIDFHKKELLFVCFAVDMQKMC